MIATHNLKKMTKINWTQNRLEYGFERFHEENGHYPSCVEIDDCDYLPTVRSIQNRFGGVKDLRKLMSLAKKAPDYNSGKERSKTAKKAALRANDYEEEYYNYLITKFPEVYVHEHKVLRNNGKKADVDFYIYYPDDQGGIGIDLFYAKDLRSLYGQVAIKQKKYDELGRAVYLVCMNDNISQEEIQKKVIPRMGVFSRKFFDEDVLPNIIRNFSLDEPKK